MKNTFSIGMLVMLAFGLAVFTACKKTTPATPENAIKMPFAVNINGTYFVDSFATGEASNGMINITADSLGKWFYLSIPDNAPVDSIYSLNVGEACTLLYSNDDSATVFSNVTGSLKITGHDFVNQRVEGIFSIVVTRPDPASTVSLSAGEFNVNY